MINTYIQKISSFIPKDRIYTDDLRLLAWGTDAGFYRLTPKVVIRSANEKEVSQLLRLASEYKLPVTFRAAGTSLSGQSITDSILIVAGKNWEKYKISDDKKYITLQPGIVGQRVNEILKPFGRKFSPDPASIKSAMVGGIVMNNASGMSCGIHANSDQVLASGRIVCWDGTILDTASEESKRLFKQSHPEIIDGISRIRKNILEDEVIFNRIKRKYQIKNVTGLNLLPLIQYEDPFDIILHLMVGSEGTLAFLSEMTMKTTIDLPYKASAMLYFNDIKTACKAIVAIKKTPVTAAELLDSKSLKAANDCTGDNLTAVLLQTEAIDKTTLNANISAINEKLKDYKMVTPAKFTDKEEEYNEYWSIRSGIFPAVGGMRKPGTTCLIEDVAFPLSVLPEATLELQQLLQKHKYDDACIYGHALEGNYHFIINQAFDTKEEIDQYEALMNDVKLLVVDKHDGSLKAEHGTGRNMAPFVAYEWGEKVFNIMKEIKKLFDPYNLLNPGVIFNDDPDCHIKQFKPLPLTNPVVDKCIECGFCENNCLTCGFTLSSRQRIVIQRELARIKSIPEEADRYKRVRKSYKYLGNQTCIADGLCSMSCPMGINVGDLTHIIRENDCPNNSLTHKVGDFCSSHFSLIKSIIRPILSLANFSHVLFGTKGMTTLAKGLRTISGNIIPQWNFAMPKSYRMKKRIQQEKDLKVVYFPSCLNQMMGTAKDSPDQTALVDKTVLLLQKAGYEVLFPQNMEALCCGMIWESKGMGDIADRKTKELEEALWISSNKGKYPILCDQSPCLYRMRRKISKMKLYEPVEFIHTYLMDKLEFTMIDTPIAIHITCSTRKMKLDQKFIELARKCAKKVLLPQEVGCCGFGGDKGFTNPEVNQYALRKLRPQIEVGNIKLGYSNSRTCEIGLTTNSGISYQSIIYLVDDCTEAKRNSI